MATLKRQPTNNALNNASAAAADQGKGKYWLTGDFFDFLNPDHVWKSKGNLLTVSHVVDDAKHSTTAQKMQKKLDWLVRQMTSLVDVRHIIVL